MKKHLLFALLGIFIFGAMLGLVAGAENGTTESNNLFLNAYNNFLESTGDWGFFLTLFFFTAIIVIYGVFVYYFYKNLARKNIIELNLNQYNKTENPGLGKFVAVIFYIIEFLIIMPILTALWFSVLAIFLVILSKIDNVGTILMICAALIAAVRVVSQISSQLAQDIAKMVPLTLLGLFLIDPNFFNIGMLVNRFTQVPGLLAQIPYFLVFIVAIEILARLVDVGEKIFHAGEV